jgi:DNA-binding NarL/FixJ family response regulator
MVGAAANAAEALKLASKHKPDVILIEARMGDEDGLDTVGKLRARFPNTAVVVFSAHSNPSYVARAHAMGAADYLLKSCLKDSLIAAITAAAKGHEPIRAGEMRHVAYAMNSAANQKFTDLPITPRETQILRHVTLGLTNKEIANALEISVETVKEHVQNMLRKLGLTDRTQAAVLAVRKGIA